MSISTTKKYIIDSDIFLSLEKYSAIADQESTANEKYLKVGDSCSQRNTPQFQWFKGSRYRGLNRDIAA